MTQEELTLVLEALKWCHGGEPCGTAEAIAVVEKGLANVATNDTSKEYVDEMQKQRHEQEPVKIVQYNCKCGRTMKFESVHGVVAPQRTWVGLTDEEIAQGCKETWVTEQAFQSAVWWAEAKLKEKNNAA